MDISLHQIVQVAAFSAPMLTSLLCCLLLLVNYFSITNRENKKKSLQLLVILMLLSSTLSWLIFGFYIFFPSLFVYTGALAYLFSLLIQVFLYHFVFIITETKPNKKFSFVHYLIPLLIAGGLTIWSLFVPYSVQLSIIESRGVGPAGYTLYTASFTSKIAMFFLYNIIYSLLGLRRILLYRKMILLYSADKLRSSMQWFYLLFIITLGYLPLTLSLLILGRNVAINSLLLLFPIALTMLQNIFLTYSTLMNSYALIAPEIKEERTNKWEGGRSRFEKYMSEKKPYKNPFLKITDIASELFTNRCYISNFINQEYGVNFHSFINQYRLNEFEHLRGLPENRDKSDQELSNMVGFSSYNTYKRFKKEQEEKQNDRIKKEQKSNGTKMSK